jgi:heparanase
MAAFGSLRIRIGGSLQDQVIYETADLERQCTGFRKSSSGLFGFSQGCLSMKRWDELNDLFLETGYAKLPVQMVFSVFWRIIKGKP